MPNKTPMSRFPIHDDLTAPEASLPILKGASSAPGSFPTSSACSRARRPRCGPTRASAPSSATARCRGTAPSGSALAVAEHYGSKPGLQLHTRTSRQAGLGIDEVAARQALGLGRRARGRAAALPAPAARPISADAPAAPARGGARGRLDATSSSWRPSRCSRMESFTAMVNIAGDIPVDGSVEETRVLRARVCTDEPGARHRRSTNIDTHRRAGQCCPALPRGGGAGGQALDRRDPLRAAARRPDALHRDRPGGARISRTACCPSA